MAKAKKFRVAVAGDTIDGRVIEPQWLRDAVDTFNPSTYGVRVNVEHIRGLSGDKPFGMVGDVIGLSVQDDDIVIDGKTEKRTALYAEIRPNERALELNKSDQKVFTSIELRENFAGTGKIGLLGIAVTDTPASIATHRLEFSKVHQTIIVPGKAGQEIAFKFDVDAPSENQTLLASTLSILKDAVTALTGTKPEAPAAPVIAPAAPAATDDKFAAALTAVTGVIEAQAKATAEQFTSLTNLFETQQREFTALKTKFETEPAPQQFNRAPISGGGDKDNAFVF
ncbi:GPO family capsid scaffolding protein [Asticcacaulis sp. BYS171W]|uniref:GPO family capsid scaffolding protein n=1 Tax=Asticcacaulis aquaticus TaxID=2984212 RepID=A0ABT5HTC4_9CAUL|nr:GPO family capsid scaffolding protein [Asticcacaulis aquaticus]MDC7683284.1 GPO family capsid scaffolding protein [Asticcacaulis aquaticus]